MRDILTTYRLQEVLSSSMDSTPKRLTNNKNTPEEFTIMCLLPVKRIRTCPLPVPSVEETPTKLLENLSSNNTQPIVSDSDSDMTQDEATPSYPLSKHHYYLCYPGKGPLQGCLGTHLVASIPSHRFVPAVFSIVT